MKPATVAEIIKRLQELPPNHECFFRPKYHGTVEPHEDVPVSLDGISPMMPDRKIYPNSNPHVCFLC